MTVNTVDDKTALQQISVSDSAMLETVYVQGGSARGDGYQGWFDWNGTDQSANGSGNVPEDVASAVWVAPQTQSDGSQGAWRRRTSELTPEMFGAIGDGVTDNQTALENALIYAIRTNIALVADASRYYAVDSTVSVDFGGISSPKLSTRGRLNIRPSGDFIALEVTTTTLLQSTLAQDVRVPADDFVTTTDLQAAGAVEGDIVTIEASLTDLGGGSTTFNSDTDVSGDTITVASHGYENETRVRLAVSSGTLPGGVSELTQYFVINVTTNTFQLALDNDGPALSLASTTGQTEVRPLAESWPYDPRNGTTKKGETQRLRAASGTTLQLEQPVFCGYDVSVDVLVAVVVARPLVLDIDGLDVRYASTTRQRGCIIAYATGLIRNSAFHRATTCGLTLSRCYGLTVNSSEGVDCWMPGSSPGYGLQLQDSTLVSISDCRWLNNRRGVDISGDWPSHGCLVANNLVVGLSVVTSGSGLGTHGGANATSFLGNTIIGSGSSFDIRSPNTTIMSNHLYTPKAGFISHSGGAGIHISGNFTFLNAKAAGSEGLPNSGSSFFYKLSSPAGEDIDLWNRDASGAPALNPASIVVSGNTVQARVTFMETATTISRLERTIVCNNTVSLQSNSGSVLTSFLNIEKTNGTCQITDGSNFSGNRVFDINGDYVEYRSDGAAYDWNASSTSFEGGLIVNGQRAIADTRFAGSGLNELLYIDTANDRIGVGTSSPTECLHLQASVNTGLRIEAQDYATIYLNADQSGNGNVYPSIRWELNGISVFRTMIGFSDESYVISSKGGPANDAELRIGKNAGVLVGGATGGAKEFGSVNATAFYENGSTLTADYVFDIHFSGGLEDANTVTSVARDFERTLAWQTDRKAFSEWVEKHRHLPSFPSQKHVSKNPLSLGEYCRRLLETVEVLSLQNIERDNELTKLKERIVRLEDTGSTSRNEN